MDYTATSSANVAIVVFPALGMSAVKIKNRSGPRHFPVVLLLHLGDGQIGFCCDVLRSFYPQGTILAVGTSCYLIYVLICKVNLGAISGQRLGKCRETRRCSIFSLPNSWLFH